jgi:hypothetical protein
MPKRNIYFTDDLVAQMKKHPDEKWSAVCQEAVETRLRYLALRADITSDAVQRAKARLATEKAAYIADAYDRGERAGIAAAADRLSFAALRNLHSAVSEFGAIQLPLDDGPMTRMIIARVMNGVDDDTIFDTQVDEREVEWVQDLCAVADLSPDSDDLDSGRFWDGFLTGALRIYEQV